MASSVINKPLLSGNIDCFRDTFKYYKKRKPSPNLDHVIDFTEIKSEKITQVQLASPAMIPPVCLKDVAEWKTYGHKDFPGFMFIVNPFKHGFQRYWVKRCLVNYPDKPNRCNLDVHTPLGEGENLWRLSQQQLGHKDKKEKTLIDKLRWVTLGYHHDWDTKLYSSSMHTEMPEDLVYLSKYIASCLGSDDFSAEAAIVNYYHLDSTLSGHTDHSEFDLEAPLISFSLGQTAIFLLGGVTKATKPIAVYLRSGDITVLSGDSRVAYHAVPRILPQDCNTVFEESFDPPDLLSLCQHTQLSPATLKQDSTQARVGAEFCDGDDSIEREQKDVDKVCSSSWNGETVAKDLQCSCDNHDHVQLCPISCDLNRPGEIANQTNDAMIQTLRDVMWDPFAEYIGANRINMNVRQVFKRGQTFPCVATDVSNSHSSTSS